MPQPRGPIGGGSLPPNGLPTRRCGVQARPHCCVGQWGRCLPFVELPLGLNRVLMCGVAQAQPLPQRGRRRI